jgi:hypothetical protein
LSKNEHTDRMASALRMTAGYNHFGVSDASLHCFSGGGRSPR